MAYFKKALVVKAIDLSGHVDDWVVNQDINDHTDESLLKIQNEYVQSNPLILWLLDNELTLYELEQLRDENGDVFVCII